MTLTTLTTLTTRRLPFRRLSFIPFAQRPPLIPAACRPLPGLPLRPGIPEQNAPGRSAASVRFVRCSPSPPPPR